MKGLYTLLLFAFFIQTCLNSTDEGLVITIGEDNQLTVIDCTNDQYGFAFGAYTSGFVGETTLTFYLDSLNSNQFKCTIPETIDQKLQTIECYADARIFPIYETANIFLPKSLTFPGVEIVGWDLLSSQEIPFQTCLPILPTNLFTSKEVSSTCDLENGYNVVTSIGSFTTNPTDTKVFLTSTDPEYTTYELYTYAYVDDQIKSVNCNIFVLNSENGGEDQLKCAVVGQSKGFFLDTVAPLKLADNSNSEEGAVRIKINQEFTLQYCKSMFIKLSSLLLISLFLL